MSSFDRRAILLSLAALAGCGLTPVYGRGASALALRGGVEVSTPDSREAFRLKARIEDRLGPPQSAPYRLDVTLALTQVPVGVSTGQDITRYTLRGKADYVLTEVATGTIIDHGQVENFTGYSATGTSVATLAADRDARDRLSVILADQIIARLLIALA